LALKLVSQSFRIFCFFRKFVL